MSVPPATPGGSVPSRVARRAAAAVGGFLAYAACVWMLPVSTARVPEAGVMDRGTGRAAMGVWRANGCQVCHSIYGLGGHTGPDLTNIMRDRSRGYVRAMMASGPPGMPSFGDLPPEETEAIIAYLAAVSGSGLYPVVGWNAAGVAE